MDVTTDNSTAQSGSKKRPKSGQEVIGQVRRGLLDAMYADGQQQRYIKRQVVENLLGVLSAARSSGFSWEEMAGICAKQGFEISPSTLKSYYVDLKEERGNHKVQKQAKDIVEEKKRIDVKRELKEGAADTLEARRRAHKRLASKPRVMSSDELRYWEAKSPASTSPIQNKSSTDTATSLATAVRRVHDAPSKSVSWQNTPAPDRRSDVLKSGEELRSQSNTKSFQPLQPGQGKSIEQLEVEAESVDVATTVFEDLVLQKDGRVYYASGTPFLDRLSPRQVRLLKTSRRYMKSGSAEARSSSSVVKMSNKL